MLVDVRTSALPAGPGIEPGRRANVFRVSHTSTFRFTALVAALVVASGLVILGVSYVVAALWERQQQEAAGQEFNALLALHAERGPGALAAAINERGARAAPGNLLDRLTAAEHRYALATQFSDRALAGNLPAWPSVVAQLGPQVIAFAAPGLGARSAELRQIRASMATLPGGMRLLVGRDIDLAERIAYGLEGALVWLLVFGLLSGILGGWVASRRMLGRIEAMRRDAEHIMAGNIRHRMPLTCRDDEFDRLAATLNRMLAEIENLMRTVRRVTDDIAHDLRSPLTRVRQQLDQALGERDDAAVREMIADSSTELDRLVSTFNALLTIATVDSGSMRVELEPVAIDQLLRDVDELYRPMSEDRQQALTTAVPAGLTARANRQLLFQALANLVENAIKYAPRGGTIDVTAAARDGEVELTVADNGPGIPAADRQRVLQPFVRLDQSRSEPGNGLGLALVAAICKFHRARLTLGDNNPGLLVRVALVTGANLDSIPLRRQKPSIVRP
jgi:signal transduction histidine kinase